MGKFLKTKVGKTCATLFLLIIFLLTWSLLSTLWLEDWEEKYHSGQAELELAFCHFDGKKQAHLVKAKEKLEQAWQRARSLPLFISWERVFARSLFSEDRMRGQVQTSQALKRQTSIPLIITYCGLGEKTKAEELLSQNAFDLEEKFTFLPSQDEMAWRDLQLEYLVNHVFNKENNDRESQETVWNSLGELLIKKPKETIAILQYLAQYALENYDEYLVRSEYFIGPESFGLYRYSYSCRFMSDILSFFEKMGSSAQKARKTLLAIMSEKRNISYEEYSWSSDPGARALVRSRAGEKAFEALETADKLLRGLNASEKESVVIGESQKAFAILDKFPPEIYEKEDIATLVHILPQERALKLLKKIGKRSLPILREFLLNEKLAPQRELIEKIIAEIENK